MLATLSIGLILLSEAELNSVELISLLMSMEFMLHACTQRRSTFSVGLFDVFFSEEPGILGKPN